MKRAVILLVVLAQLPSCHHQKPKFSEAQIQKMRARTPFITDACLEEIRWGGIEAAKGDCTKRFPPTVWRGLWRNDFEGSLFCPAPAEECDNGPKSPAVKIYLDLNPEPPSTKGAIPGGLYAVEFVGRRSSNGTFSEGYGYQQDIKVDRLISIKQVEPPPRE